ncbi:MAG: hypothetical protein M1564_00300 [Candidatus Marsarchaeota archaeon]|nr:hypothetical protein [Candidatus Marsarchaeota archaeon]
MRDSKAQSNGERYKAVEFGPGNRVSISDGGTSASPDRSICADEFNSLLRSDRAVFVETELVEIVPKSAQELVCYNGKYTNYKYLRVEGTSAGRNPLNQTMYIWDSKNPSDSFDFISAALSVSISRGYPAELRAVVELSKNPYSITYKNHHIASYNKQPSMVLYVTEAAFRLAQGLAPNSHMLDEFFELGLPPFTRKEQQKHQ